MTQTELKSQLAEAMDIIMQKERSDKNDKL